MKLRVLNNGKHIQVYDGTEEEVEQLKISLVKRIPNAWFHPLVKKKLWDGKIHFIDSSLKIAAGLWKEVEAICNKYKFDFYIDRMDYLIDENFDYENFKDWVKEFFKNSEKKPKDYQIEAAALILKHRLSISELATSAGKTLIMFMVYSYLKVNGFFDSDDEYKNQFLVIVPNVSLILQTYNEFYEHASFIKDFDFTIQMFGGDEPKVKKNTDIIIGTFQTLRKLPEKYYTRIKALAVDESHFTDTKSVSKVLDMCNNAKIKFGVSGTTKAGGNDARAFTMQRFLGPFINKVSPDFLSKNKYITPIKIKMIYMNYLEENIKKHLKKLSKAKKANKKDLDGSKLLALERQLIIQNEKRFEFIVDLIMETKKNSLVLFNNVKDSYGKKIFDALQERLSKEVSVFYVDGSTDKKTRKFYIDEMNKDDNHCIMVASFGTFSTGISINSIEYIFLVESFKSEVIIKQSFGRGMRLKEGKKLTKIIDFVDDFSIDGWENYTLKHSYERESLYNNENFKYKKININL